MKVLVTGGAGYIGSHAVKRLRAANHDVVVLDNLYLGHRAAVPEDVPFHQLDIRDTAEVAAVLEKHGIECVMHFAALASVPESCAQPLRYYEWNTAGGVSLLTAMHQAGVKRMVFSSTCASYGEPPTTPITEDTPQNPINPYGASKLFFERVLKDYTAANPGFAFAALRYFNVAGSAADGTIGEDHDPETHLIPLMLLAALGKRDKLFIFGDDYPTPDGTCVRDYIHVEDLADAHAVVMEALADGDQWFYNLGIGKGLSVKELVDSAKRVTGVDFTVEMADRRPGDPPTLFADPSKINNALGWQAGYTEIDDIVATAWNWFKHHPDGYGDRG